MTQVLKVGEKPELSFFLSLGTCQTSVNKIGSFTVVVVVVVVKVKYGLNRLPRIFRLGDPMVNPLQLKIPVAQNLLIPTLVSMNILLLVVKQRSLASVTL